jgi:poly(hydroxyalkanoate) depolymerase family esterase
MLFPNARARRRTLAWLVALGATMAALWAANGHAYAQASTPHGTRHGSKATATHKRKATATHKRKATAKHKKSRHRVRRNSGKHHKGKSGSSGKPSGSSGSSGSASSSGSSGSSGSGKPAGPPPTGLSSGSYTNSGGTLTYEVYVPTNYHAGTPLPVVVALHGCGITADTYRQVAGWDTYAQSKGFIVLLPQQSSSRNYLTCWNWFQQADMQRGSGEPAIIAGMVNMVEQHYTVDTQRVYVAGFSAGGAMANVMAATYPDVFAAVGSGSGCEYNGLPCVGYQGPDPTQAGQQAYQAMGKYARMMPAIVFQGTSDSVVAPANGPEIVKEWQMTDDMVLSGSENGPLSTYPMKSNFAWVPNGRMYTVSSYPDNHGNELIEYWSINGMDHAWSGGASGFQYSDPSGPSETDAMWTFFSNHPMP